VCLFINDNTSLTQPSSRISQADARVGEPLTPMSVAGVGRRHARRAVRRSYAARYGTGGYYDVYPAYPGRSYGAYGSYANRSYVTGRPTVFPRYYGAYAAGYPGGYYSLYGGYDGYDSVYPAGYYGGYAFPRYYNTGWMWWW
jgi:hypothetical protein